MKQSKKNDFIEELKERLTKKATKLIREYETTSLGEIDHSRIIENCCFNTYDEKR